MNIPTSISSNIVENSLQENKKITNESSSNVKLTISVLKFLSNLDIARIR